MKKVDQTNVVLGEGNCMQAVVASLLELDLKKVPNFIKYANHKTKDPYWEMYTFMEKHGYKMSEIDIKIGDKPISALDVTEIDGGINGYFYAEVPSQTHSGVNHAVVVDKNLNIVHDPNPNRLALDLTPDDIIHFYTFKDNWYFDLNGKLQKDK